MEKLNHDAEIIHAEIKPGRYKDTVVVECIDGGSGQLFSYYNDELSFTANEFVGKTVREGLDLFYSRDKAYLQS